MRILAFALSLMFCLVASSTQAVDDPPSPAWGGQKVRRTYSSSEETQKKFEKQIIERMEQVEDDEELETQPLWDEGEADPDEEEISDIAPKRASPVRSSEVKKYRYAVKENSLHVIENKPIVRPENFMNIEQEIELDTQPWYDPEELNPRKTIKFHSVKTRLDRTRVHLDESFTMVVEVVVSDLSRLSAFRLPQMKGFNLINEYQSEATTMVNGKNWWVRTKQYVFLADKPGRYALPGIVIYYAGKRQTTKKLLIDVEGSRSGISYTRRKPGDVYQQDDYIPGAPEVGRVSKEKVEFFAEVIPERVYVNQQAILKVRLQYTSGPNTGISYRPPRLTGFLTEELPEAGIEERVSGAKQSYIEKEYRTVLFPVRPGRLVIDVAKVVITRNRKNQTYITEPLTLDAAALPEDGKARSEQHQGSLVGQFTMQAKVSETKTEVDRPVYLEVVLKGKGNIRGAADPYLRAAEQYRIYIEDKKEKVYLEEESIAGERIFRYLVVFDKPGKIRLGSASMRFFDPEQQRWQECSAPIPEIKVTSRKHQIVQVKTTTVSKKNLNLRPNHSGAALLSRAKPWAATTLSFWILQALGPALIGLVLLGKRWQAQAVKDADVIRLRRAYATAKKSLRQIRRYMRKREDKNVYDGLANTASDYLATKFEIPKVYVGTESLPDYFAHYEVPAKLQQRWKAALTACEYVRYAAVVLPGKDIWSLYQDVKTAIQDFEKFWVQRNRNKAKQQKTMAMVAGLLLLATAAQAGDAEVHFWRGNAQAEKGDHQAAEAEYRKVLSYKVVDSNLYYNLGNTYLQQGKLGPAVLTYWRGLRLSPRDPDLHYNLKQAQELVEQKRTSIMLSKRDNILIMMYQALTPNEIMALAVLCYFVAITLIILILLWPSGFKRRRPILWMSIGLMLIMGLWSGLREYESLWHKQAIVMIEKAEIYNRPYAHAEILHNLPEGTRVSVQREEEAWVEVSSQPGQRGWIKRSTLGFID
ncbi:BatD family protein [bacterium]|nr:BatD family protein [bacterium]